MSSLYRFLVVVSTMVVMGMSLSSSWMVLVQADNVITEETVAVGVQEWKEQKEEEDPSSSSTQNTCESNSSSSSSLTSSVMDETSKADQQQQREQQQQQRESENTAASRFWDGSDYGVPQQVTVEDSNVVAKLVEMHKYMQERQATTTTTSTSSSSSFVCTNNHASCVFWASVGECANNPGYMLVHCAPVCQSCELLQQHMQQTNQQQQQQRQLVQESVDGSEYGVPQRNANNDPNVQARIADMHEYMQQTVFREARFRKVRSACTNKHESCAFWAAAGECGANPAYMHINCAPVCQSCEQVHIDTRCPLDPTAVDALAQPGDLNRLFERIVTDPWFQQQYKPQVLSRPTYAEGDDATTANYQLGMWLLTFDNIVTDDEADRLVELGGIEGYERSTGVGKEMDDGSREKLIDTSRTSHNAWCLSDVCVNDPVARRVMERISNITGIPVTNSENFQLLRYEVGQYYRTHHDYIGHHTERQCGVRILTFYLYLNNVEEGGGTNFPVLNQTVLPQKGRAVLWPSVLNEDPNAKDPRADHQALPVIRGVKYGANAWIHQRDFRTPNANGCT